MQISLHSSVGKQRKSNQDYADYFKSDFNQYLFVLCDGVGGHQAGEVASELTTKYLGKQFKQLTKELTKEDASQWIGKAIEDVNIYLYEESLKDRQLAGMGTTLVVSLITKEFVLIAHVGDSRAYVFNEGHLIQKTEDHSLVNELIRSGEITEEEGNLHPQRNVVTQSIGVTPDVGYELLELPINEVEHLMLCSDGLTNMVSHEEIVDFFQQTEDFEHLAVSLVDAANEAGGRDNITIIVVGDIPFLILEDGETT
ncbi:MAG: Stp1/IreP family PP2C-type Ser/Thr phosphatase [Ruoffia tabacinasalis]|uniref:Stp1/IreP family PP2C-type Ser/Thr phosphatase n=1 Tax=Ruoffia sp. FAM 26255 TaxID=3259519 RepID=UPI00388914A0